MLIEKHNEGCTLFLEPEDLRDLAITLYRVACNNFTGEGLGTITRAVVEQYCGEEVFDISRFCTSLEKRGLQDRVI